MDLGHRHTLVISPFPFSLSLVATAAGAASAWSYRRLFLCSLSALAFIPGSIFAYASGHGIGRRSNSNTSPGTFTVRGLDFLLLHPLLAKGHHWRGEGFLLDQHGACVFFFLLETVELTISLESKSVQNRVVEPFN